MNTNRINNNIKRFAIAAGTTAGALFLTAGLVAGIGNNSGTDAEVAATTAVPQAAVVVEQPVIAEAAVEDAAPVAVESIAKVSKPAESKPSTTSKKAKRTTAAANNNVVLTAPSESTQAAPAPGTTVAPAVPNTEAPVASAPALAAQPAGSTNSTTAISIPKLTYPNNLTSKIAGVDLTGGTTTITAPSGCIVSINC